MTGSVAQRLDERTVLHAHADLLPDYDRSAAPVITHIGLGAFARAHVAVYADALLRMGHPALIRGVTLRSRLAQQQLEPQDGLFTVAVREPGEDMELQVVAAIASVTTGPAAALEAITAPTTSLVTLTITEKGYESAREADASAPPTAPALIASALARRRQAGLAPPVFASLDNLLDNGGVLRTRVLEAAEEIDPRLAAFIAEEVRFPASVVDRMVPAPTDDDRQAIANALGLRDEAAVATERHRSWVMQSVEGLDHLGEVGVQLVDGRRRLRTPQALAAQRTALRRGLRGTPGRALHHRSRRGGPARRPLRPGSRRSDARGGRLPRLPGARRVRRRCASPLRQSCAETHVRPGRRRRVEQAAPAPPPRRGGPPRPGSPDDDVRHSWLRSGSRPWRASPRRA